MEVENGKVNGSMPPKDPIGKPPLGPFGTKVSRHYLLCSAKVLALPEQTYKY
jgi:hypothetical protein